VASLVWPDHCLLCRSFLDQPDERGVCRECLAPLRPRPDKVMCPRCGYPLATPQALCPPCRGTAFLFDRARSAGEYAGALRELIHQFKFAGASRLAGPLAGLLADAARLDGGLPAGACVAAVPLHPRRRRQRGYDQAELLARAVARRLGLPHRRLLRKVRAVPPQSSLGLAERAANIRGAFRVRRLRRGVPAAVLLVDDIFTTGATVNDACRALTEAGVETIHVLTLARVPLA